MIAQTPPDRPLVYVAGPLSGDHLTYIQNLHRMLREANDVRGLGLTPFIPGIDFLFAVSMPPQSSHYTQEFLYGMSAAILRRLNPERDCVYAYAESPGVRMELQLAVDLGIRVAHSIDELRSLELS